MKQLFRVIPNKSDAKIHICSKCGIVNEVSGDYAKRANLISEFF